MISCSWYALIALCVFWHQGARSELFLRGSQSGVTPPTRPRAFATLMLPTLSKSHKRYTGCLLMMIESLQSMNVKEDIVVLYTPDTRSHDLEMVRMTRAKMIRVEKIASTGNEDESYRSMLTKLHIWTLTQYSQIAYYDADMVFMRNPSGIFDACGNVPLCAVSDVYISPDYFNAGMMVLTPSMDVFEMLYGQRQLADGTQHAEQDMLNEVFRNQWKKLPRKFNFMHPSRSTLGEVGDVVAVHEKWWRLIDDLGLREEDWIWNRIARTKRLYSTFEFTFIIQ